jgi:hypothetical protein
MSFRIGSVVAVAEFLLPRLVGGDYTHRNLESSQGGPLMKPSIMPLLLAVLLGPLDAWDATGAWAQSRHEPRIEGVSFSEIARWQSWYGGGPSYGPAGLHGCGVDSVQPAPVYWEPVQFEVKKVRKGKKARK